ncbi:MAG: rane fusion protein cobalt-zinc-cadmium efflux system [Pseudomonadota bacterium]|jgi:cobalt-zinc-cadmium efflux system membrane fusion protein
MTDLPKTHKTPRSLRWTQAALLSVAAVLIAGCGDKPTAKPSQQSEAPRDPMQVSADAELASRLSLGPVATRPVTETIRVAGRLDVNQYRTSRIGAPITGRLTRVDAVFGQQVRQGQVLAEINSPELAQAQLAFLRAHSEKQLMTRAVERAQLLLSADVIASAELQRRQNELSVVSAEKRAASDQLRQLGLSPQKIQRLEETGEIQPTAAITATLGGTVLERNVAQGQVVNPSDVLFVVSDLNSVWALAEVPEQDSQFVKLGQRVQIEIPALDNERFAGRVAFVADVVNPETRTVRVGVEMENKALRFKPSMLMTMLVEGPVTRRQVIPVAAVVRENNVDHVFVQVRDGVFRLKPVRLGPAKEGLQPLLEPLPENATLVLDGAFHLNNVRVQQALESR